MLIYFLETDLSDLIKTDKLVFIDITADWCATCQFNKLNVLDSKNIITKCKYLDKNRAKDLIFF